MKLQDGQIVHRHIDHILSKLSETVISTDDRMSVPDIPTVDKPMQSPDTTSLQPLLTLWTG